MPQNRFSIGLNKRGDWGAIDRITKKVVPVQTIEVACELCKDLNAGRTNIRRFSTDDLDESWNVANDDK